jgi:hypothetical protein
MASAVATSVIWPSMAPHDRAKTFFHVFYEAAKKLSCLKGKEVYVLNSGKVWNLVGYTRSPPWEFYKFHPDSVQAIHELFVATYDYVQALQEAEGSDFTYTFYEFGGKNDEITQVITQFLPPVEIPRSSQ